MNVDCDLNPARKPASRAVVYRGRGELKPDPANPRRHSKKQVRQIADSIRVFGFNVPVLIDRDGNVIAGHGRLLAAEQLGWSEVPTLCLDHLTAAQARAFRIADNKLTENAEWDDRLLAQQLKDLSLIGLDFSLELTGFEMAEIDMRILSLDDTPEPAEDTADVARPGNQQARRCVAARPSRVMRQHTRFQRIRRFDGRATRRDGIHRPALQCAD